MLDHYEIYDVGNGWRWEIHLTNKDHSETVEIIHSGYADRLSNVIDAIQKDRSNRGYFADIPIFKNARYKTTMHYYPM